MTPPPTHTKPPSRAPKLPDKGRLRDLYEQVAPILAIVCLLSAFSAVGWSWQNSRADHRQDQQRIGDQAAASKVQGHLLACFDDFATQLAGGLPPVRVASAARDDARAAWENASDAVSKAIEKAIERAVSGAPTDGSQAGPILGAFHDLDAASAALDEANATLDEVRAANPYPPAPSTFCD